MQWYVLSRYLYTQNMIQHLHKICENIYVTYDHFGMQWIWMWQTYTHWIFTWNTWGTNSYWKNFDCGALIHVDLHGWHQLRAVDDLIIKVSTIIWHIICLWRLIYCCHAEHEFHETCHSVTFISWKKTPNDAMTPQRQSQFTPKMKANAVPRLLSSLVWIDSCNECNWMTIFMEFMSNETQQGGRMEQQGGRPVRWRLPHQFQHPQHQWLCLSSRWWGSKFRAWEEHGYKQLSPARPNLWITQSNCHPLFSLVLLLIDIHQYSWVANCRQWLTINP